ncbi:MAG: hypothetical protein IJT82_08425 [Schwartzia sp.]|nr:hypothetical protein [Schwartzia sp. (in: firmicutes)]
MMAMNAEAINALPAEVFSDILKKEALAVLGSGYVVVPIEKYYKMLEDYEDAELEREAKRRLQEPEGRTYTQKEMLDMYGIKQEELDAMPEVELE